MNGKSEYFMLARRFSWQLPGLLRASYIVKHSDRFKYLLWALTKICSMSTEILRTFLKTDWSELSWTFTHFRAGRVTSKKYRLLSQRNIAQNASKFHATFHANLRRKIKRTKNEIREFRLHYFGIILYVAVYTSIDKSLTTLKVTGTFRFGYCD